MSEPANNAGGLFSALRRILDSGLATVQNRVELFAVELREEKCRLVESIILASAAVALGMMTLTLVTLGIVFLFWDNARVPALFTLGFLYFLGAAWAWTSLRTKLKGSLVLADTLDEIKKDRECLQTEK